MSTASNPRLNRLPFWLADATLLGAATVLVMTGARPLRFWEMVAVVACVALGGWFGVLPALKQYEADRELAGADRLADTTAKLTQLEDVADRIAAATGQWQAVQERATQTADVAKGVVERLAREAEQFGAVVSRTADAERQRLKLEVDKLRKGEAEWVQSAARVMDHVFALHIAAVRSGQPGLAEQIEKFHGACRDAFRRVGFSPMVAAPDEPFDRRKHQVAEGSPPVEGGRVDETVAPGFVFQGQLVRPVIVRLAGPAVTGTGAPASAVPDASASPDAADAAEAEASGQPS